MPRSTLFSYALYTNTIKISLSITPICEKNRKDMLSYTKINVRITVYTSNTAYFLKKFSLGRAPLRESMILWVLEAVLVADVHCIKIRSQLVFGKRKDQYCATHVQSLKDFEVVSDADSERPGLGSCSM